MYDFQAAVNAARAVVEKQENAGQGQDYKYPLVYPQAGHSIVVRPLFNPASGQIVRLINRHEKIPCYRTYGIDCPICKTMQQVKDMTGQDPFGRKSASKSRGVCFAQYISSTYTIDKGNNKGNLQPGEIILFMFPWSVYSQINTIIQVISQTPTGMEQAFSHASSGMYVQVTVSPEFKYTATQVPYMTFPTNMSDDDFMRMLDGMESLMEQVLPSTVTEDVDKQVRAYNDELYKQYIAPRVQQVGVPSGTMPQNFSQIPQQPAQVSAPVPPQTTGYPPINNPVSTGNPYPPAGFPPANLSAQGNMTPQTPTYTPVQQMMVNPQTVPSPSLTSGPACIGNHKDGDPKCICCPAEMQCIQTSGDAPF